MLACRASVFTREREANIVSYDDFRQELLAQMERCQKQGAANVPSNSAELQPAG